MKLQVFVSIWSLSTWYLYITSQLHPAIDIDIHKYTHIWSNQICRSCTSNCMTISITMSSLVLEDYKLQPQQNPRVFRPSSPSACSCDRIQNLGKRSFVGHIPIHAQFTRGRKWPKITIALQQWDFFKGSKLGFPSQKNEQLNYLPRVKARFWQPRNNMLHQPQDSNPEQFLNSPSILRWASVSVPARGAPVFLNGLGKLFPVPCVRDRGQSTNQLCQFKCLSTQQSWWLRH